MITLQQPASWPQLGPGLQVTEPSLAAVLRTGHMISGTFSEGQVTMIMPHVIPCQVEAHAIKQNSAHTGDVIPYCLFCAEPCSHSTITNKCASSCKSLQNRLEPALPDSGLNLQSYYTMMPQDAASLECIFRFASVFQAWLG